MMLSMTNASMRGQLPFFIRYCMFAALRKRALPEGTRRETSLSMPATGDWCFFSFRTPLQPLFSCPSTSTGLQDLDRHAPPAHPPLPPPPTGAPGWSGTSGLVPLPVHGASTPVPLVIGFAQHDLTCPAPWAGIPRTLHPPKHHTTAGPTITHPNPLPTTASLPFSVLRLHNNPHPPPSTKLCATLPDFSTLSVAKADPISNHRHSLDPTTTLLTAGNCLSWTPRPKNADSQTAPQSIDDDSLDIQHRSQFANLDRYPLNRVDKIRPRCIAGPSPKDCTPEPNAIPRAAFDAKPDARDRVAKTRTRFTLATPLHLLEFSSSYSITMHSSLPAPVLQVDANVIHKVDTSNPENLFSMWTGEFSRAASLEPSARG